MNQLSSKNEKSLVPLIVFLSIVVLLTVWIVNFDIGSHNESKKESSLLDYGRTWNGMQGSEISRKMKNHPPRKIFHFNSVEKIAEARRCLEHKNVEKAEDLLRTVLVFEPENTDALSMLGGIFYYSGRYSDAEYIFKQESVILPESAMIYNSLASAQARQKKYSDAILSGQKALALNPDKPQIHLNLAGMYSISGNKQKALVHFIKAFDKLGKSILPLMNDSAFDNIRDSSAYQLIISKVKSSLPEQKVNHHSENLQK